MAVEGFRVVLVALGNETLRAGRRHERRQLSRASPQLQPVIYRAVLVAHSGAEVRVSDRVRDLERKDVAVLIEVAKGGSDLAAGIAGQTGQVRIAPDGRILPAVAKDMGVMKRNLRPLRDPQTELKPGLAAVEPIFRMSGWEPQTVSGEETAVAVIPSAKLGVTS